jgi:hypothetical protein
MQVALGHRRGVVPAGAEEPAVAVDEARKRIRDAIEQRSAQRPSVHTLTRRIDALTSPLPVPNVLESSDSARDLDVKWRCRAVRTASGFAVAVPHAVAATVYVKSGWEHSCQGDFVKLTVFNIPGVRALKP